MSEQKINKKVKEIKSEIYDYAYEVAPYLKEWRRNPYTYLKCIFYIELSSTFVHFLLKTKIKPNTVSIAYGFSGIIGAILLAIPNTLTMSVACAMFFLKGVLDWCDGPLARITGQTSFTGELLDTYGGSLGTFSLYIGLGFYVAQKSHLMVFYYLIPLIPFFYAVDLNNCLKVYIFGSLAGLSKYKSKIISEFKTLSGTKMDRSKERSKERSKKRSSYFRSVYIFIQSIFDERARSVDLICLIILVELYTQIFVTWIIFLFIVFRCFLAFCASLYIAMQGKWAEGILNEAIEQIRKSEERAGQMKSVQHNCP